MEMKSPNILLVDDNPGDARLTLELLSERNIHGRVFCAKDGVEALDFLRKQGTHVNAPRPDLILLDLNMPRKDGREVLAEIKSDPVLKGIPVVVLSGSNAHEDVLRSYNLHANCYVAKPVNLDEYTRMLKVIQEFWLTVATLPSEATP